MPLSFSERKKEDKYDVLCMGNLQFDPEDEITHTKVTSLAFGSFGTIDKRSSDKIKGLGIPETREILKRFSETVLCYLEVVVIPLEM